MILVFVLLIIQSRHERINLKQIGFQFSDFILSDPFKHGVILPTHIFGFHGDLFFISHFFVRGAIFIRAALRVVWTLRILGNFIFFYDQHVQEGHPLLVILLLKFAHCFPLGRFSRFLQFGFVPKKIIIQYFTEIFLFHFQNCLILDQ